MANAPEQPNDYFNSSRENSREDGSETPPESANPRSEEGNNVAQVAKPKRIACIICRKRKLRCDGSKPSCGTCSRLNHKCAYDEVRRKSGPKRGYVKELEARLAQVETQLKSKNSSTRSQPSQSQPPMPQPPLRLRNRGLDEPMDHDMMAGFANVTVNPSLTSAQAVPNVTVTSDLGADGVGEFPWEMIGLGLDEPLPPQDMIDEMHQVYFSRIATSFPMIHKYRYLAAMNLAPHMRPAICLRYAIWALACSVIDKYYTYSDVFYQRARKYAESDEMKGHGETFITVGHTQCWVLVTMFEFKMLYFPRAWMSAGRGARLAMMLGLHRQDGSGLEVKQVLPPPRDWTDKEERRRTFWAAYCNDRYASIGTGWPMTIDECDILTNLPASMEAYESSTEQNTASLPDAMTPDGAINLSSFAGVVVLACLFGKNLTHLHRSGDTDHPDDPSGEFWKRHHKLDNILMTTSMYLPDHLRLPQGSKDANVVFLNMNIHSATICLHQAAILKAEKHKLSSKIIRDSTDRCFLAAGEIVTLMRLVSQIDITTMNPFISFCLYVAARIYTHAYKKRPTDETIRSNLDFLLITMQAHRKKNPISESFLVQLMVELDAAGLEHPIYRRDPSITKSAEQIFSEGDRCPPVFPTQSSTQPSFHEIHQRESASPITSNLSNASSGSRVHSPQPQYKSSFAVPGRDQMNLNTRQQAQPTPTVVPSQGWGDQGFISPGNHRSVFSGRYDAIDSDMSENHSDKVSITPAHSHRGSARNSYSPQAQAPNETSINTSLTPNSANVPPGQDPFYIPAMQYNDFGTTSGFSSQPPTVDNAFTVAPDWDMQNAIPDNEWGQVLDNMNWEDANQMQSNLGNWRAMQPSSAGQE